MTKIYTLSEVAEHNTAKDCWLVIDGKVYDVSSFLGEHPGGEDVLLSVTAKDATDDFEDVGHSNTAKELMKNFEVGEIEASLIPRKLNVVDRATEPQYNHDKSGEFNIKILQILLPLAFLALAVASYFFTTKQEVAPEL